MVKWRGPTQTKTHILEIWSIHKTPEQSNLIKRYQLRCLKQEDMSLEEFLTKARTLVDDSGYDPAFKEETLRDTLAFRLKSDKVRKDATSKGNSLTFQQVYDLAKTEESTKAQMQAITQGDQAGSVHSVRRKQKPDTRQSLNRPYSSSANHAQGRLPMPSTTCRQAQVQIQIQWLFQVWKQTQYNWYLSSHSC